MMKLVDEPGYVGPGSYDL